jgi:hypothetical protein
MSYFTVPKSLQANDSLPVLLVILCEKKAKNVNDPSEKADQTTCTHTIFMVVNRQGFVDRTCMSEGYIFFKGVSRFSMHMQCKFMMKCKGSVSDIHMHAYTHTSMYTHTCIHTHAYVHMHGCLANFHAHAIQIHNQTQRICIFDMHMHAHQYMLHGHVMHVTHRIQS